MFNFAPKFVAINGPCAESSYSLTNVLIYGSQNAFIYYSSAIFFNFSVTWGTNFVQWYADYRAYEQANVKNLIYYWACLG